MATGRTSTKWIRFLVYDENSNTREIPINSLSPVGFVFDETDTTAYQDQVKNYLAAHPDAAIDITGPLDNKIVAAIANSGEAPVLSGSHTVLAPISAPTFTTPLLLAVLFGIRGYWADGDPVFGIISPGDVEGYVCTKYQPEGETYSASFKPAPGAHPAWGTTV